MGIKGIYKEIGPGARISFLHLAVDCVEKRDRPLRIAIDISIWQFQVQAARGGSNPAVRTLFYRLVRLLGMPVQPIFVFDGPNKPLFKRNKRSAGPGDTVATAMAKRMIRLFGFYIHDAPGEAEAECALLQQRGVVDAVLSEDVDTLMFGCTRTLRNWSAGGAGTGAGAGAGSGHAGSGNSASSTAAVTHVTMYETDRHLPTATGPAVDPAVVPAAVLRSSETGLDREGMVLVALMSGGDYLPEGVPGCGVKLACEAARAGFGRSLCRIKRSDAAAFAQWRATLQHELRTNESRFFRTCHRKLVIPDDFPNIDVLRYYTHPVVSSSDVVERVRVELAVHSTPQSVLAARRGHAEHTAVHLKPVDVLGLREFVAETFDWTYRGGAVKFVRVLAPGLLARMLLLKWSSDHGKTDENNDDDDDDDDDVTDDSELFPRLVEGISRQRTHASTDDTPELRVAFVPLTVVGIDLDRELDDPEADFGRDGIALNSDDDFDDPAAATASQIVPPSAASLTVASAKGLSTAAPYDPAVSKVAWVPRSIVARGAPGALQEWDQKQQRAKKPAAKSKTAAAAAADGAKAAPSRTRARKTAATASGMPAGALDKFVSVTKNTAKESPPKKPPAASQQRLGGSQATFKPVPNYFDGLDSDDDDDDDDDDRDVGVVVDVDDGSSPPPRPPTQPPRRRGGNPWALAGSSNVPRVTKTTASPASRQTKPAARTLTTPVKRVTNRKRALVETPASAKARPDVISLLSSEPLPAPVDVNVDVDVDVDIASSPAPAPAASFSSLAWSPTPLPKTARDAGKGRTGRDDSSSSPKPRRRQASPASSSIAWPMSSPQKQTSIRDFMTSQSQPQPVRSPARRHKKSMITTILLSDDDDDDHAVVVAHDRSRDDPFASRLSSSKVVSRTQTQDKGKAAKTTTRYVPRKSAAGYFREETGPDDTDDDPHAQRGWRLSEIGVVDLTGHDR